MAWRVGVEVPEDLAQQTLRVQQGDGQELEADHLHELRWPLADPLGTVVVEWGDESGARARRRFESGEYRVFKLTKAGDRGRAVSRLTRGHYIAITPETFERAKPADALPPVAPERVMPEATDLLAHHLLAGAETADLVFSTASGGSVEIRALTAVAYELAGQQIEDAHRAAGPLFGREPPRLRVVGAAAEPALVVVGLEGPAPRRRPRQAAAKFDELRRWFDQHEPGWFFVRLYDANDDLLDSLDFRYARCLEAMELPEHSPLPQPDGHRPALVRFRSSTSLRLVPLDGPKEITSLRSVPTDGLLFPAHPDASEAILRLHEDGKGDVEVVVQVPRVWWAFTSEDELADSSTWTGRPQQLSTGDLLPTSPKLLSVLLPTPGWADSILVGFRGGFARPVPVLRSERRVDYPLRALGDEGALRRDDLCQLLLSVDTGASLYGPVVVAEVRGRHGDSQRPKKHRRLDLASLSAPRLMSVITQAARFASNVDRRTVHLLRVAYYKRARNGGRVETREFLLQGLALIAALLLRGRSPQLPSRWRWRAESLATMEPAVVAEWQLRLRQGCRWGGVRSI